MRVRALVSGMAAETFILSIDAPLVIYDGSTPIQQEPKWNTLYRPPKIIDLMKESKVYHYLHFLSFNP